MIHPDIERVLLTKEQIEQAVDKIAAQITEDFCGEELVIVCIMNGSLVFTADLMRKIGCPVVLDFMKASSYGAGTSSSGFIKVNRDIETNVEGKNVLIIEDIIDSGNTLYKIKHMFLERNVKNLKLVTLLDKPSRREADISVDYVGFQIPDEFVVGYGLDYDQKYRNLPYVGVLKRSVYEK